MDFLKKISLFTLFFLSSGCAKLSYVFEQGVGQLGLFSASRPYEVYLEDESLDPKIRAKIEQIQKAKSYFINYWQRGSQRIYQRVTQLEAQEVTTLVVASPYDEVSAHQECFWLVGCFPYLGFYKKKSAQDYASQLENKGLVTYLRPVYAYSTLGYFHDPVLSSFFIYEEEDLVQLIFHEMYHTIFFAKNEVDLNENLANYFATEMFFEYFDFAPGQKEAYLAEEEKRKKLNEKMVILTQELNLLYAAHDQLDKAQAQDILENFKTSRLRPFFEDFCQQLKVNSRRCFPLRLDWNNASLAAFLTYEKKADLIKLLREKKSFSLKELQLYIEQKYQQYRKSKRNQSFEDFLLKEVMS